MTDGQSHWVTRFTIPAIPQEIAIAFPLSTERLAYLSAKNPKKTIFAWLIAVVIAMVVTSSLLNDALTTEFSLTNNPESTQADDLLEDRLRGERRMNEVVIVKSGSATVDDPAFRQKVEGLFPSLSALRDDDGEAIVESGTHFFAGGNEGLVSVDRRTTIMPLTLAGDFDTANENIEDVVHEIEAANDADFEALTTGQASVGFDFREISLEDLEAGERIGVPIALIILVGVFGVVVAAVVPVIIAVVAILIAFGLTALVGQAFDLSFFVTNMLVMIGLPVGIDYSLFIVERYREERVKGLDKMSAIARSGSTASRAVVFSGMTVVLALVGMLLVDSNVFKSMGAGTILVVLACVLASLTLLPAIVSLLGDNINRLRVPFIGRVQQRFDEQAHGGFWDTISRGVMRVPLLSLALGAGLLIAAAIPFFDINTGAADVASFPDELKTKQGFLILSDEFPDLLPARTEVVIDGDIASPAVQGGIDKLTASVEADPSFGAPTLEVNPAGDLALLSFSVVGGDAASDAAVDAVKRLRRQHVPAAFDGVPAQALVAGDTAFNIDFFGVASDAVPLVFAFVLGMSLILLTVVFRSVVVALKSIVLNLLSVGAAYGLVVLVFQKGFAAGFFGFQEVETIEAWLPVFLFSILFGLSMDYHVFLISRIREHFDLTGDNKASVAFGIRSTGRLITGAALIMVAVFGGFASGELAPLQQMGFGLGIAVLLDATIVRMVLVPAAMALLGNANWYLPSWLRWLPDVRVDATPPDYAISGGPNDEEK